MIDKSQNLNAPSWAKHAQDMTDRLSVDLASDQSIDAVLDRALSNEAAYNCSSSLTEEIMDQIAHEKPHLPWFDLLLLPLIAGLLFTFTIYFASHVLKLSMGIITSVALQLGNFMHYLPLNKLLFAGLIFFLIACLDHFIKTQRTTAYR